MKDILMLVFIVGALSIPYVVARGLNCQRECEKQSEIPIPCFEEGDWVQLYGTPYIGFIRDVRGDICYLVKIPNNGIEIADESNVHNIFLDAICNEKELITLGGSLGTEHEQIAIITNKR